MRSVLFFFMVNILLVQSSSAAIKKWIAPKYEGNKYWSSPQNWSPYGVPLAGDHVVFEYGYETLLNLDVNPPVLSRITTGDAVPLAIRAWSTSRTITLSNNDTALFINGTYAGYGNYGGASSSITLDGPYGASYGVELRFINTGNKVVVKGLLEVREYSKYNATNTLTEIFGLFRALASSSIITSSPANFKFRSGSYYENGIDGSGVPFAEWALTSTCVLRAVSNTSGLDQQLGNVWLDLFWDAALDGKLQHVNGNLTVEIYYYDRILSFTDATSSILDVGGDVIFRDRRGPGEYLSPTYQYVLAKGAGSLTINVNGKFEKTNGSSCQLNLGAGTGTTTINVKKDFIHAGTPLIRTGSGVNGQINFVGTNQSLKVDTSDRITYNTMSGSIVTLSPSTPALVINKSSTLTAGSFNVQKGSRLIMGNKIVKGTIPGNQWNTFFNVADSATVELGSPLGFTGNVQTSTKTLQPLANVTFNGSVNQVSNLTTSSIGNLLVNNSYGVSLSAPLSLARGLQLNYGCRLNTTIGNILTLKSSATVVNGGGYVYGPMQRVGSGLIFPVGSPGTGLTQFAISGTLGATDTFRVQHLYASAAALGPVTAPNLTSVSNCDYWDVTYLGNGTPAVTLSAYWNQTNYSCANIPSALILVALARFGGGSWNSFGAGSTSGTQLFGIVNWNNVSSFGKFALGKRTLSIPPGGFGKGVATAEVAKNTVSEKPGVKVWPNPSTGIINLTVQGHDTKTNPIYVMVCDLGGRTLRQLRLSGTAQLRMEQPGQYMLVFRLADGTVLGQQQVLIIR